MNLTDLKVQALELLGDPSGARYSSDLLSQAFREVIPYFDKYYPRIETVIITLDSTDREVSLDLLTNCIQILSIISPTDAVDQQRDYSPPYYFYYKEATPYLKFTGTYNPTIGDQFLISYITNHWIDELDDAEQTTIPYQLIPYILKGACSFAKSIRANSINEAYGTRSSETERLRHEAEKDFADFISNITGLHSLTMSGYPPGFDI